MSSIGGILSIARTAIYANQAAIQIASHNIGNANTEGYSRQRPLMSASMPVRVRGGLIGTGVTLHDVNRVRDAYLDLSVRRESSNASGFGMRRDILMQVEGVFGEPSETGLSATLDAFWSSWGDLANAPDSLTAKNLVRQRGLQVASTLNGYDRSLSDIENSSVLRTESQVREFNTLLKQVADLNERITTAEVGGATAGDLRDARDLAIDHASRLADVRVLPRSNGSIGLALGNTNLVDGNDFRPLELEVTRASGGRVTGTTVSARGVELTDVGGALGGALDALGDIRGARAQMDSLARMVVQQVNLLHNVAPTERDFFHADPTGVTAGNIRLSDAVRNDAANVVAGAAGTDNSVARALGGLRDLKFTLTTPNGDPILDSQGAPVQQSLGGYYRDLVAGVAFRASDMERSATAAETLVHQAQLRRESVSGVSIDEELILLMRHQQAYTAATKLVSAADEMLQSILNMV